MAFQRKFKRTAQATVTLPAFGRRRLAAAAGAGVAFAAAGAMVLSVTGAGAASASTSASARDTATAADSAHSGVSQFGIADPNLINETATLQASQLAAMKAIGI